MLTIQNTEAIRRIEAAIGYTFNDKRLLVQVLTRKTYLKIDPEAPDNEVLEFYGDTLMNYHVTNYFVAKYAHMLEEGLFFMRTVEQFTDLRSHYVCNRYLTERVKALGLARYLRAQNRDSELRRDSEKAYADIFESLVGAIYLDSYQNEALIRAFILRQLGIDPKRAPTEIESFDYDTLLEQPEDIPFDEPDEDLLPAEPAMEEMVPIEEIPFDAIPVEEISIEEIIEVVEAPAEISVEVAAKETPVEEKITSPTVEDITQPAPSTNREKLNELCKSLGYDQPTYRETPPNAPNARTVAACTLTYKDAKGKQVKISLNDSGKTLAEATEKAAAKMLAKVERQVAGTAVEIPVKPTAKAEKTTKPTKFKADKHPDAEMPAPVEVAPIQVTPAEVAPAEVATVVETSVAETPETVAIPVEDIPVAVEEKTVEESIPAEASEEIPVEEAPVAEIPAEDDSVAETPAAVTSHAEETPAEIPVATEDKAVEEIAPAEDSVEIPVEIPAEVPAVEVPVEAAPAAEDTPKKKTPAKKKSPAKKKTAPIEEKTPEIVAEESKAREINPDENMPVEKTPTKKKTASSSKKKAEAPVEPDAEPQKPRAPRKSKTKKEEAPSGSPAEE